MDTPKSEQNIIRMTAPVYDFPGQRSPRSTSAGGSPTMVSLIDRLLLTQTVWLHLSVNSATALHILQREPPGTFLVRTSNTRQQMVLCVRLSDDRCPSFIHQTNIHEGPTGLFLEASTLTFPDLVKLVAHYCREQDVLPYTLRLPRAIEKVTSRKQLEAISRLGLEFWGSSLNSRDLSTLSTSPSPSPPPPSILVPSPIELPDIIMPDLVPALKTRSPQELSIGGREGALCFFNPLFKTKDCVALKRNKFKKSIKVRVSTENSGSLSPPLNPPPPVPSEEAVKEEEDEALTLASPQSVSDGQAQEASEDQEYRRPRSSLRQRLKKSLSKGSVDLGLKKSSSYTKDIGDYKVPAPTAKTKEPRETTTKTKEPRETGESNSNGLHSLEEQDSGSGSSVEEGTSEDGGKYSPQMMRRRKKRSGRSSFRAMSGAFLSLLSPERKILLIIEEMGRNTTTEVGKELQEFLKRVGQGENKECKEKETQGEGGSYKTILKEVRDFMDKIKHKLRGHSELQLDTLSLEEEDRVLEKSLHRLILKPLRSFLASSVQLGIEESGELDRLGRNMQTVRKGGPALLGVALVAPTTQELEKIRQKLLRMQEKYSPSDKVRLLLQACQGVYRSMDSQQDDVCGADEFLPALCYVLALCDLPQILMHTHYTIELLSQDMLVGEGGYYLTSVSAALSVLASLHTHPQDGGLSLSEWHRRRQGLPSLNDLQNFLRVAHQDPVNGCTTKTILLRPTQTVADLTQICSLKFKALYPEEYGIFLHTSGDQKLLPPNSRPQEIKAKLRAEKSSFYFCYQRLDKGECPENGETQDVASKP